MQCKISCAVSSVKVSSKPNAVIAMKRTHITRFIVPIAVAGLVSSVGAANFTTGYTIGSGLLGPTLVDGADHAGLGTVDLRANDSASGTGAYGWLAVWENLWGVGDAVSITGIAVPLRSPGAAGDDSNNTDNGTFTFTFYELSGGVNLNIYDGTSNGETVLGTATAVFNDAGSGAAIIPYVTFDSPIAFTSTSTGIGIHMDSTSSIRTRWDDSVDGVDGINHNLATGATNGKGHQWTIAGSVTPVPEPSSFALGGLAMGAMLLARRRRQA
jgi:hypothetical protein